MKAIRVSLAVAMLLLVLPAMAGVRATDSSSCIPAEECCKVCDTGKACGNSCVSRKSNCHKGPGCACNSEDVCP